MNPSDMKDIGIHAEETVVIKSAHGEIKGEVVEDETLKRGVVAMAHAWGGLPEHDQLFKELGSNTGRLISTEEDCARVTHMPRMSAIPVRLEH